MDIKDKIKHGYSYQIGDQQDLIAATGYGGVILFIDKCREEKMPDNKIEQFISIYLDGKWKALSEVAWRSFYKKANKTQTTVITETFGEKYVSIIENFLDDIVDIYPYEQWNRDSNKNKFKTIGASKTAERMFYVIGEDQNIYMKEEFKLFPTEKPE